MWGRVEGCSTWLGAMCPMLHEWHLAFFKLGRLGGKVRWWVCRRWGFGGLVAAGMHPCICLHRCIASGRGVTMPIIGAV